MGQVQARCKPSPPVRLNASKGLNRARNRNWCARNFPALVEETGMVWKIAPEDMDREIY